MDRAAYNGHSAIVKILLEAGSEVEVYDESGRSPADVSPPETRAIIQEGAQRMDNARNENGGVPSRKILITTIFILIPDTFATACT
jgi:ankyrin repeat protein